jgi:hypothetical protein
VNDATFKLELFRGLAVGCALIAVILLISERVKHRPKIAVTCQLSVSFPSDESASKVQLLHVHAVNVGHKPVELVTMGFQFSNRPDHLLTQDTFGKSPLPRLLAYGEYVTMIEHLAAVIYGPDEYGFPSPNLGAKRIRAFATDAAGHTWRCRLPLTLRD